MASVLAAAACIVAVVVQQTRPERAPDAAIARIAARVEAVAGQAGPLRIGADVAEGSGIETEATGRIALRLGAGQSVRIDSSSSLRIVGPETFVLERGGVYVDSGIGPPVDAAVTIRTPYGEVHDVGTQFEVRLLERALRVRVREGAVVLRAQDDEHQVPAATELEADGRGSARMRSIQRFDPSWDWALGIVPLPDLEGITLRAFLEHVAREGGFDLEFDRPETARLATETVLRGSVPGLTIDRALETVLPTCGMDHRIQGGRLIVGRTR
jgi:ferric-dicitrate binding protein FerR (iron transport regulator)